MKNFMPESPKIKYIIPKVHPSFFILNEDEAEEKDILEKNKLDLDDENDNKYDNFKLNTEDSCLEELEKNSIYKTLINIKKRNESVSSIETKDSFNIDA